MQNKLEALIDRHMQSIGASKVSLSSISTETLWRQSGRFAGNSELLRVTDRRKSGFLLSPTHEEEITALVGGLVHSYKDLPLRLYQVGRKYRDERRPRQGLLRAKEFIMKDLYTFDDCSESALKTYEAVRSAYNNLFTELRVPFHVVEADSGNMGGKLSHEYHYISSKGEDALWSCNSCEYAANEEVVEKASKDPSVDENDSITFEGISKDSKTAIRIHVPGEKSATGGKHPTWNDIASFVNMHAVKRAIPEDMEIVTGIESATLSDLLPQVSQTIDIYDRSLSSHSATAVDLTAIQPGDPCPRCDHGSLHTLKAIEVGHTFHLGSRYSEPLNALVALPGTSKKEAMQMGCHGIGVSRIIGALASLLSDDKGLNWPRAIAPYEGVILTSPQTNEEDAEGVYDALNEYADVVLDDRPVKSLGWKLKDADLIGYPIVVVLGRGWKEHREVEVQCRRLGIKKDIDLGQLRAEVEELLQQL